MRFTINKIISAIKALFVLNLYSKQNWKWLMEMKQAQFLEWVHQYIT